MRSCGGIMASISATLMPPATPRGTLIVKSSSLCTVRFFTVELVALIQP